MHLDQEQRRFFVICRWNFRKRGRLSLVWTGLQGSTPFSQTGTLSSIGCRHVWFLCYVRNHLFEPLLEQIPRFSVGMFQLFWGGGWVTGTQPCSFDRDISASKTRWADWSFGFPVRARPQNPSWVQRDGFYFGQLLVSAISRATFCMVDPTLRLCLQTNPLSSWFPSRAKKNEHQNRRSLSERPCAVNEECQRSP